MALHNPNNWHWVNKDVKPWAQEYLEKELVGLSAEDGKNKVEIERISSMDGDVDVSQRKGKVITLFDVRLVLEYKGTAVCHWASKRVARHLGPGISRIPRLPPRRVRPQPRHLDPGVSYSFLQLLENEATSGDCSIKADLRLQVPFS